MDGIRKNVEQQIRWMCIGFAVTSGVNLIVSLLLHLSYLPTYYIIAALIYLINARAANLRRFVPVYLLCWMLIAVQSCLTVYVLGDDCGIQMYLLVLIIPSSYIRFTDASFRTQRFFQVTACCLCIIGYLVSDELVDHLLDPLTIIDDRSEIFFTLLNVTGSLTLLGLTSSIFVRNYQNIFLKLLDQSDQLTAEAEQDALTGLKNRRGFEHFLAKLTPVWEKKEQAVTVALGDVDFFKNFNDTYGHDAGDSVLKHLGFLAMDILPPEAIAFRWGGEEFLFLFPMPLKESAACLEQLRAAVAQNSVSWENEELRFTITIGVSSQGTIATLKHLIQEADQALYKGKEAGRNRVVRYEEQP